MVGKLWTLFQSPKRVEKEFEEIAPLSTLPFAKLPAMQQQIKCISRESNPGHIDGNDVFYH